MKEPRPKSKEAQPKPKEARPKPKDARPKADPFRIVLAEFVAGAGPGSTLPAPALAEIAFAGRSNVGKSSLINTLVERKGLVRTSSTPGSTRQVNLYEARAADGAVFRLVDLPGYGFTKRSKAEQSSWSELIEGYLRERPTLAVLVIIVDVRRGVEEDDRELIESVESGPLSVATNRRPVKVFVVATKVDKVSKSEKFGFLEKSRRSAGTKVLGFSSVTGEGRSELWRAMRAVITGAVPD